MTREPIFEGSFRDASAGAVLECGVCWWQYRPEVGDPEHGVQPGTPFSALPEDWRCPECQAPKMKFMVTCE
ncbi:rubredoxin [Hydrogenophilus islandicus]